MLITSIDKIKENDFKLTKERSRTYPAKTITDVDYTDDIALLANAPALAETLLHSLERAATGIGLHVNAHKTEYMCFNQTGNISTLNGSALKLVGKFTYVRSSVSSTERLFSWAVWHSCRMGARNQEQTRGRIGPQLRLGNLRVGELHFCPLSTALDQASSLSRKLAYVPGPTFGFVKLLASSGSHCTK